MSDKRKRPQPNVAKIQIEGSGISANDNRDPSQSAMNESAGKRDNTVPATKPDGDRDTSRQRMISVLLAVATFITAVAALHQSCVGTQSADAAKRAVDVARDQLVYSARPWISVEPSEGNLTYNDGDGVQLRLQVRAKNVGHSVATDVSDWRELFADFDAALSRQQRICDDKRSVTETQYPIFPDADQITPIIVGIKAAVLRETKPLRVEKGVPYHAFVLVGCISYRSGFQQRRHQTRYAYMVARPRTSPFAVIGDIPLLPSSAVSFALLPLRGNSVD